MKKAYIIPSQEIIEIKMSQYLLAGSELDDFGGGSGNGDGADVSAPFEDFDFGPEIPGAPGFGF